MGLKLDTSGSGVNFSMLKGKLEGIASMEKPPFVTHRPDFRAIKSALSKHTKPNSLIVAGNGGSIRNFQALAGSLPSGKTYHAVNTSEPDFLRDIQEKSPKEETLVMPVSKSGTNVTPIEAMFWFHERGYRTLPVTGGGILMEFAKKNHLDFIVHPDVPGRFSGRTSCALAPSHFLGIDIEAVNRGAESMYRKINPDVVIGKNIALQQAAILHLLERRGYSTAFFPVYSVRLSSFIPLITQLMHESVCKSGKGQTFFGDMGPEIQHHSTQRFFGGKRDMLGILIKLERFDDEKSRIRVPKDLWETPLRDGTLGDLDGTKYSDSVRYDFEGVRSHATKEKIPHTVLSVDKITPETVGEFMAFWQYVALYTSLLGGVDPFNQPEVEFAKKVSFDLRMKR